MSHRRSAVLKIPQAARRVILCRYVRGTGKLKRSRDGALGAGGGGPSDRRWIRQSARADRSKRALGAGQRTNARPRHSAGRWSLLYSGRDVGRDRALEATCWMLLRRYGIVFRESSRAETILPKWREVSITLRRLEDRGEFRGGRFVSGFFGRAIRAAGGVESLRAQRNLRRRGKRYGFRCRSAQFGGNRGAR